MQYLLRSKRQLWNRLLHSRANGAGSAILTNSPLHCSISTPAAAASNTSGPSGKSTPARPMISRQEQSLAGFSFDNDPWPYKAANSRRMPGETEMHNGEIVLAGRLRMLDPFEFPARSILGPYGSATGDRFDPGVQRDDGLVVIWDIALSRRRCSRESPCTTNTHG